MIRPSPTLGSAGRAALATMCAAALAVTACNRHDRVSPKRTGVPLMPNISCSDASCTGYTVQPYVLTRSRYGIGCLGNVPPGTTPNPEPPPESFSVKDIGKPGFPALKPAEASMLRRIERYVHSRTLRIAWVDAGREYFGREFIVFDAKDGPCEVWAGGYSVLNGGCNEFYQPGENPYHTHAGSGCYPTKRPWMIGA